MKKSPSKSTKTSTANARQSASEKFDAIVAELESKFATAKFSLPFKAARPHFNPVSKTRYSGMNAWILPLVAESKGFKSKAWMTFKQAQSKGWQVDKGQTGTPVQFWSTIEDKETKKEKWFSRFFYVFNVDQLVDEDENPVILSDISLDDEPLPDFNIQEENLMALAERMGFSVSFHDKDRAYVIQSKSEIHLPFKERFSNEKSYLAVFLHELGHATSRYTRPKWEKGIFGSLPYAKEEVVAELTAVFTSSMFGVQKVELDDHAAYLADWLSTAKEDDKNFFTKAIKEASKASLFMWDTLYSNSQISTDVSETSTEVDFNEFEKA